VPQLIPPRARRRPWTARVGKVGVYAALTLGAVAMVVPFLWMVRSSLVTVDQILKPCETLRDFIPSPARPRNYAEVFEKLHFWRCFGNTTIITVCVLVGTILSSSLCAYAFAYCRVPYRNRVFYFVLATMMLPGVVTLIPVFIMFRTIGWVDTFNPLIVPAFFGQPFAIFLFRQFYLQLPRELFDAARVDGASNLRIWATIVLPLSKPVVITVAIFSFMATWNDFMGPLIFLNSESLWTLQLGLASFMGLVASDWHLLMAGSVIVLLPVLIVFLALQRYFVSGIVATGLKG
jgi:ABC-type glycerol-3-phosphate transport system permease component